METALAINVGANTNLPGFRAPVDADGRFVFVPIPEREPLAPGARVPTYGDLELPIDIPAELRGRRVHLDPEFAEYPYGEEYTYGDEHGVKAGPIGSLERGDHLCFYATLTSTGVDDGAIPADWGAYMVGIFELARDPYVPTEISNTTEICAAVPTNAHCKRAEFDARVVAVGRPAESRLLDRAVPLSRRTAGTDANQIVTDWSNDSGRGPWWRRPLRFEGAAATRLVHHIVSVEENGLSAACWR